MHYGTSWRVILDTAQEAPVNMAVDEAIARVLSGSDKEPVPTLRIYQWSANSLSIGYFQEVARVVSALKLKDPAKNYHIVRRPTGGSAVIHDRDLSFALILKGDRPDIIALYSLLGRCVTEALRQLGVSAELCNGSGQNPNNHSSLCISRHCPHDVVHQGRKVAGYAARRLRGVTLVQGYVTLVDGLSTQGLSDAIIDAFKDVAGATLLDGTLTDEEKALAVGLREEKYTRREWNCKR
ncbi:MAG: biotin/lipoate A/B protein ligase family protein [Candidatus Brocadiales bacterium]